MTGVRTNSAARLVALTLASISLIGLAAWRLQLSFDLAFFLPSAQDQAQQVLLDRIGQGPGSQLIMVLLPLPQTSDQNPSMLAETLRRLPSVLRVLPEPIRLETASVPPAVWHNRLLLADLPTGVKAWTDVIQARLDDSFLASEPEELALLAADPVLASINALTAFTQLAANTDFQTDIGAVLIVQSSAAAFDIEAQAAIVDELRKTLADQQYTNAKLYGAGVYGVDLRRKVQREATLYSLIASFALVGLVLWRFRSFSLLLTTALPLVAGGAAAIATVALLFSEVHGITLAFGFTLLGVAVDYPLHLVVHQQHQHGTGSARAVWPTLRLGIASTLVAYLAFALSGTQGLQQLGVFAMVGISSAAAAAYWLTNLDPGLNPTVQGKDLPHDQYPGPAQTLQKPRLNHWPWLTVGAICTALAWPITLTSDNLSQLTPVAADILATDSHLRTELGISNIRHLVALRHPDQQTLLRQTEQLNLLLDAQVASGALVGYQSVSSLLPSLALQQQRKERLNSSQTLDDWRQALLAADANPDAFSPFTQSLAESQTTQPSITWSELQADPTIGPALTNLMYPAANNWVSLTFLRGIENPRSLQQLVDAQPHAFWVDLKQASESLAADYRRRVMTLLGFAFIAILLMLLIATRDAGRVLWLAGTLAAAVGAALLLSVLLTGPVSLFGIMALTLVAGLGLDYALFYSKPNTGGSSGQLATHQGVTLCALSSLLVFGILATSSIPLLSGIGTTVACGVLTAYLLARFSVRHSW